MQISIDSISVAILKRHVSRRDFAGSLCPQLMEVFFHEFLAFAYSRRGLTLRSARKRSQIRRFPEADCDKGDLTPRALHQSVATDIGHDNRILLISIIIFIIR